jgi:hypothetical protein
MCGLGHAHQPRESFLGVDVLGRHDDPERLTDHRPPLERPTQAGYLGIRGGERHYCGLTVFRRQLPVPSVAPAFVRGTGQLHIFGACVLTVEMVAEDISGFAEGRAVTY